MPIKKNFEMKSVISSNLASVGYFEKESKMRVKFKNGQTYEYEDIPKEVYKGIFTADSPGKYFRSTVLGSKKFNAKKL